jgi:hypothetical protein
VPGTKTNHTIDDLDINDAATAISHGCSVAARSMCFIADGGMYIDRVPLENDEPSKFTSCQKLTFCR